MKTYPMMVTLKEARKIYQRRAAKYREKQGFPPILPPTVEPLHTTKRKIKDAVTLTMLEKENATVKDNHPDRWEFHKQWTKCVGTAHYDKNAWKSVEKQMLYAGETK